MKHSSFFKNRLHALELVFAFALMVLCIEVAGITLAGKSLFHASVYNPPEQVQVRQVSSQAKASYSSRKNSLALCLKDTLRVKNHRLRQKLVDRCHAKQR